ncbi:zinc knuckle CX2CX4HX4C containing protein [Tanacetum coccineum]
MIRNIPIILKKWSMTTRLSKEELTRIPVWVNIHDVRLQVFLEDGISIIAYQLESLTMGVLLIKDLGFSIETVRIEYEWKPPQCYLCKIFGHVHDQCPKKVTVTPIVEKTNDGFQMVANKKKNGKAKSTNGGKRSPNVEKGGNINVSNSYAALDESEEEVENVFDESANLLNSTKTSASSSTYTVADG